jgi:hypothetical protein
VKRVAARKGVINMKTTSRTGKVVTALLLPLAADGDTNAI